MRLYMKTFLIGLQQAMQYRLRIIINILVGFIPVIINCLLWIAIYRSVNFAEIDGFTCKEMISYLIMALIINNYLGAGASDYTISEDIKNGGLSKFLLKPINNFLYYITTSLPESVFYLICIFSPIMIALYALVLKQRSPLTIVLSIVVLFLAYILHFMLNYLIGLLAFWTTSVSSFIYMKDEIINFLSGNILPLSFFPALFIKISNFLPFQYMVYFPINAFLNESVPSICKGMGIQCLWILILYVIIKLVWSRGLKRYSSVGN